MLPRVMTVVGARPQLIKAQSLSPPLRATVGEVLVHTGQHYSHGLSSMHIESTPLPEPEINLGIGSMGHGAQTGRMLEALENCMADQKPRAVVVYGDTNSTLAATLAAAKLHIPVVHVEAGLRSFDRSMPEEVNRVLTDHASTLLFGPTREAMRNLEREGLKDAAHFTGDLMYDSFLAWKREHGGQAPFFGLRKEAYGLLTIHRPVNTDTREALETWLSFFGHRPETVVLPLHPRTLHAIHREGLSELLELPAFDIHEPLNRLEVLNLAENASWVCTDSGGLQKEAFMLGVRCVVLRNNTEWAETLTGSNLLCENRPDALEIAFSAPLRETETPDPHVLYGGGRATERMVALIQECVT